MNQKIVDYLQQNKDQYAKEDLVEALKKAGHKNEEIQEAVSVVYLPPAPTPALASPESLTPEQQNSISQLKSMETEKIQSGNSIPLPQQKKVSLQSDAEYAGFWVRVAAFAIDGGILFAVSILFRLVLSLRHLPAESMSGRYYTQSMTSLMFDTSLFMVLGIVVAILYSIIMLNKYQATLGKMVVGIIVCNENSLDKPSISTIIRRTVIKILTGRFTAGLIYFIALVSPEVQALHDNIAHTVVVYKNKK